MHEAALRRGARDALPATPARSSSCSTRDRPLLLHGDEHAPAGRAPGDRGGHRHRPRARAAAHRRGRAAAARRASRRRTATRSSSASTPRIRRAGSCRRPGLLRRFRPPLGPGRARRHARLRGLHGAADLRLAARQADRARDDDRPAALRARRAGAGRARGRGHRDDREPLDVLEELVRTGATRRPTSRAAAACRPAA